MNNKKEKAEWELILIKATVASLVISSAKDVILTIAEIIKLFK